MRPCHISLENKKILALTNQWDVIELLNEILPKKSIDLAENLETALEKTQETDFDIALIDISSRRFTELLSHLVHKAVPTIILTQNGTRPDQLIASVKKGAIAFVSIPRIERLPKLIQTILSAPSDIPPWKIMFDRLDKTYNLKFGPPSQDRNANSHFWDGFEMNWNISKGIQERLLHNPNLVGRGI